MDHCNSNFPLIQIFFDGFVDSNYVDYTVINIRHAYFRFKISIINSIIATCNICNYALIGMNGAGTEAGVQSSSTSQATGSTSSKAHDRHEAAEAEGQRRKEISQEIESLSPPCQVEFQCSLLLTEHPGGSSTAGDSPSKKTPTHSQGGAAAVKRAKLHVCVHDARNEDGTSSKPKDKMVDGSGCKPGSKVKGHKTKRSRKKGGAGEGSRDLAGSAVVGESADPSEKLLCVEFEWISGDDKDMLHQIVQYFKNKCQNINF